jgi:DNA recombination protein RmuC
MEPINIFVSLLAGLLVGAAAIWLVLRERISSAEALAKGESQIEIVRLNERLLASQEEARRLTTGFAELQTQASLWRDQLDESRDERAQLTERVARQAEQLATIQNEKQDLAALRDQLTMERQRLSNQIAELTTNLESERIQNGEKIELLKNAEEQLSDRFKTLASEILEDKTKRLQSRIRPTSINCWSHSRSRSLNFRGKYKRFTFRKAKIVLLWPSRSSN